jgi:hypothetical protein
MHYYLFWSHILFLSLLNYSFGQLRILTVSYFILSYQSVLCSSAFLFGAILIKMIPKLLLVLLVAATAAMAASPPKPVDVPFPKNYVPSWAADHIKYINGGNEVQLSLDKWTGIT